MAVLRTPHAAAAAPALRAVVRGGFRVVEITLNTPEALQRIAEIAATPDVVVGAGTVLSASDAHTAEDVRLAAEGIAWIRKKVGERAVTELLDRAPRAILAGEHPGE